MKERVLIKITARAFFMASLLFLVSICFFARQVAAQESATTNSFVPPSTPVVNINNAKIVEQNGNIFKISFDLSYDNNVQSGLKYYVSLIKRSERGLTSGDDITYPEIINFDKKQNQTVEITYETPTYLQGTFLLRILIVDASGLKLAGALLGDVELNGDGKFLEINNSSCYLKVVGESGDKRYGLGQGVDIENNEKLVATCEIINNYDRSITFLPKFNTYLTYGNNNPQKIVEDNQEPQTALSLNPQEKKEISFVLPKASKPQVFYDAVLTLTEENKVVSNFVAFYYVLRGSNATIQDVKLDKNYYTKDEIAKLSFSWSSAVFVGLRLGAVQNGILTTQINITDKDGQACIGNFNKELNNEAKEESFDLSIVADCINPQIGAMIKDAGGQILDQKTYSIESQNVPPVTSESQLKRYVLLVEGIIILAIIIILVAFYVKKKRAMMILFFSVLAGSFFLGSNTAKAYTTYSHSGLYFYYFVLDKTDYLPGEQIKVTTFGWSPCTACGGGMVPSVNGVINGVSKKIVPSCTDQGPSVDPFPDYLCSPYPGELPPSLFLAPTYTFTAQSTPGTYSLMTYHNPWYDPPLNNDLIASIPYNVVATNNASCVVTAPASVTTGQSFSATVVANNNGTKIWNLDATPHRLGSWNPWDNWKWGLNRVNLPAVTNPGSNAIFNFTATASTAPGSYTFDWKMVEDGLEWFGTPCSSTINVALPACACTPGIAESCSAPNTPCAFGNATFLPESGGNFNWTCSDATVCTGTANCSSSKGNPLIPVSSCAPPSICDPNCGGGTQTQVCEYHDCSSNTKTLSCAAQPCPTGGYRETLPW